jgi:cell division protease FtsH
MVDFERAKDKVMMGAERRSMVIPRRRRTPRTTRPATRSSRALLPHADPVHKVTIIPRGRALGVTMQLPEGDRYSYVRARDRDGARHGHRVGHVRRAGPDGLRRERGRSVPRPLGLE